MAFLLRHCYPAFSRYSIGQLESPRVPLASAKEMAIPGHNVGPVQSDGLERLATAESNILLKTATSMTIFWGWCNDGMMIFGGGKSASLLHVQAKCASSARDPFGTMHRGPQRVVPARISWPLLTADQARVCGKLPPAPDGA
jgi:hypothetical protein